MAKHKNVDYKPEDIAFPNQAITSTELWETTMDPERRTLKRIELEDAIKADEIFTLLMGEKVEPRKEFIETNARYVTNLDY